MAPTQNAPGEPAGASRPFDARRCGMVPGEGSAALVLESREPAERRGAKVLARGAGFANRFEPIGAGPPLQRHAAGAETEPRAIEAAIASVLDAGFRTADIARPDEITVSCSAMGQAIADRI